MKTASINTMENQVHRKVWIWITVLQEKIRTEQMTCEKFPKRKESMQKKITNQLVLRPKLPIFKKWYQSNDLIRYRIKGKIKGSYSGLKRSAIYFS